MDKALPSFASILTRTIVTHTVTFFATGVLASLLLDYSARMVRPDVAPIIRGLSDPILIASPLLQPIRAALLAVVFYLLRGAFFQRRNGWLILWCTLAVLGILAPFSASFGGFEGMIFFNLPIKDHITGWPEVFAQTLFLSVILTYWVNHPKSKWLGIVMGMGLVLTLALPVLALVSR